MTGVTRIIAEPLTPAAFAPFGQVIGETHADGFAVNDGTSLRLDDLAAIETGDGGRPLLNLFLCRTEIRLPYRPRVMECHPLGSQAFLPRQQTRFLVLVAPPSPVPDLGRLRCFLTDGDQGVNYAPGVWHIPLASLSPATYVVLDRGGPGDNCREVDVAGRIEVVAAA